jgi:hypothetical protein
LHKIRTHIRKEPSRIDPARNGLGTFNDKSITKTYQEKTGIGLFLCFGGYALWAKRSMHLLANLPVS